MKMMGFASFDTTKVSVLGSRLAFLPLQGCDRQCWDVSLPKWCGTGLGTVLVTPQSTFPCFQCTRLVCGGFSFTAQSCDTAEFFALFGVPMYVGRLLVLPTSLDQFFSSFRARKWTVLQTHTPSTCPRRGNTGLCCGDCTELTRFLVIKERCRGGKAFQRKLNVQAAVCGHGEALMCFLSSPHRQYMNRKGGFNRPLDFIA